MFKIMTITLLIAIILYIVVLAYELYSKIKERKSKKSVKSNERFIQFSNIISNNRRIRQNFKRK